MKKVLLAGYYGHDNLGDEAIAEALTKENILSKTSSLSITLILLLSDGLPSKIFIPS